MQAEPLATPALLSDPAPVVVQPPTSRVLSIDVLRGVTIAFMILVNDPGDQHHTYTQLEHAAWNGLTLTDLVFPNFLFLVGCSIILSLHSRLARGASRGKLALNILRRAATIFLIDLFLTALPYFHLTELRLYGVLTRIAICYLVVALLCLFTQRARTLFAVAVGLLVTYWALMRFVPIPGIGIPTHDIPLLDQNNNLTAWIDRGVNAFTQHWFHTGRLYEKTRDPEGLLSTLPSIATTLFGTVAALWLRRVSAGNPARRLTPTQCRNGLALAGVVFLAAGALWNLTFPVNKNLWTSSYALVAGGCSLLGLALCYWLIDVIELHKAGLGRWLAWPWLVFGSNAIIAYASSVFLVKILFLIKLPNPNGPRPVTGWFWAYNHLFSHGNSTNNTSLAFAIVFVILCFLPNWLLWRKRLFLKV